MLEGQRDWQSLPQKRLTDGSFQRLLRPTLSIIERKIESINNGVFGGNQVQFTQLDVMDFFKQYSADILFLDPPYSHTKDYNQANAVLDDILFGENVSQIKSRLNFNNAEGSLNAMFESARHFPIWILTYGNNDIDRDGLKRLVQSHVPHRKVIARSRLFKHLPHVSKKSDNQELLIIAAEKGLCHV